MIWFFSSLFSAIIMWLAMWLLTRRTTPISLGPVLWICIGAMFAAYLSLRFLGSYGLIVTVLVLAFAVYQWCCLPIWKAVIVALVWLGAQIIFGLYIHPLS